MGSSSSKSSNSGSRKSNNQQIQTQVQRQISSDEQKLREILEVFVSQVRYFTKLRWQLIQNIFSQQIHPDMEFHIIEYMDDIKVHSYQINIKITNNNTSLRDQIEYKAEAYLWKVLDKPLIDTFKIQIMDIIEKMENFAEGQGKYNLMKNNCQDAANHVFSYYEKNRISI